MVENGDLLTIGTFSLFTRLSQKALRLYEEKGLLVPAKKEITGYRWYSYKQIRPAWRLRALSDMGFGLEEMREAMGAIESGDRGKLDDLVRKRIAEIDTDVNHLLEAKRQLENHTLFEVMDMKSAEATIKEIPPVRVVSIRARGTYDELIPKAIGRICMTVSKQEQARFAGPPMVIYHDNEYKEKDADIEIAVPVTGRITVEADMEVKTLEATKVVSVVHKGAYHKIGDTWARSFQYAQEHQLKVLGQCRELYLNDPTEVPEGELLTEVQLRFE